MAHDSRPHRAFAAAVAAAGIASGVLAAVADVPPLGRPLLALVSFVCLYLITVAVRLAWHGRTFTKLGSGGAEIPDVELLQAGIASYEQSTAALLESSESAEGLLAIAFQRLDALEARMADEPPTESRDP